jgi:hypothetical protein
MSEEGKLRLRNSVTRLELLYRSLLEADQLEAERHSSRRSKSTPSANEAAPVNARENGQTPSDDVHISAPASAPLNSPVLPSTKAPASKKP